MAGASATTSATSKTDAPITASAPGPSARPPCWSFCSLRSSCPRQMAVDTLGRPLRDLRISVTDRCNFRCTYCMPREVFGPNWDGYLPRQALLTFEEIAHLGRLFVREGVEKIRLTGGEPLLRRDIERLVEMLARTKGVQDLAL